MKRAPRRSVARTVRPARPHPAWVAIALLAAGSFWAASAQAALVTFGFAGAFSQQTGFADPAINFAGATISGSYTFDSTTADNAGTPLRTYSGALTDLSATIIWGGGSFTISAVNGNIQVEDNAPAGGGNVRDRYVVQVGGGSGITDTLADYIIQAFNLSLVNAAPAPNNAIVGLSLPLSPPDLADFGSATIALTFTQPGKTDPNSLQFRLTDLTTTRVPEPGVLALIGLGIAAFGAIGRRRSRSQASV